MVGSEAIASLLGQILSAGVSLGGLILVFLGFVVSSFESYDPQEKRAVRERFAVRVWLSFAGLLASVVAAAAGLIGQLSHPTVSLWVGVACLTLATMALGALALQTARGVR
jgi:protein-S-isoprenylcysteine O-methyltransferase Ste14